MLTGLVSKAQFNGGEVNKRKVLIIKETKGYVSVYVLRSKRATDFEKGQSNKMLHMESD